MGTTAPRSSAVPTEPGMPASRPLADRPLELEAHELVDLGREFEGQLVEDLAAEAADDHADRLLHLDTPLLEVEQLVLADLARRGLAGQGREKQ